MKPICKLTDAHRNAFAIIRRVKMALEEAGQLDKLEEFSTRVMNVHSYDEILALCLEYVEVE
jgi:hypothetical protein